jgi:hypothetical protein
MDLTRFEAIQERIAIALERIADALTTNNDATAKAAKATTTTRRARFAKTDVIRLTELTRSRGGNPKRLGTGAWHLFALYKNGMTVDDYIKAVRAQPHRPHAAYEALRYDVDYRYITVAPQHSRRARSAGARNRTQSREARGKGARIGRSDRAA